jgi:hypothetical protein
VTGTVSSGGSAKTVLGVLRSGLMTADTEWTAEWDEEFKKCAVRVLFQPTETLTNAYCSLLKGQPARGLGIHVRTGKGPRKRWNDGHANPVSDSLRRWMVLAGDDRTWNEKFAFPKVEHFL